MFLADDNGRLYTVSFDISVYSSYVDQCPTLLRHGYGVIFSFEQIQDKGIKKRDEKVCLTIAEILNDFLSNKEDTAFLVYQCDDHKQEKLFTKWFSKCSHSVNMIDAGYSIEIKDTHLYEYFGFIAKKSNPQIETAMTELITFILNLG